MKVKQKAIFICVMSLFLVVLDRVLKFLALKSVSWLVLFENDRIAFSLPLGWSWVLSAVVGFILLVVVSDMVKSWRSERFMRAALWCVLFLGAASNLYDRLVHGFVIDYVQILNGFLNIADVMIVIGLFALLAHKKRT